MAELSAAADPGSGHLLGHVPGDGQAVSVAAHHVGSPACETRRCLLFISSCVFTGRGPTGLRSASLAPKGRRMNITINRMTSSNSPDADAAFIPPPGAFHFHVLLKVQCENDINNSDLISVQSPEAKKGCVVVVTLRT